MTIFDQNSSITVCLVYIQSIQLLFTHLGDFKSETRLQASLDIVFLLLSTSNVFLGLLIVKSMKVKIVITAII
jgi:hypothetical protein